MGTEPTESRESAERLLKDYVAVVNRVLEENRGKFPYEHALRAARTFWGERPIRTLVYGRDPQDLLGVFFLRLEPDTDALAVLPPGDHDFGITWKASMRYLWDVAANRPQWYAEHPMMLDWSWFKTRISDEASRQARERPALVGGAVGFVLGALVTAIALRGSANGRRMTQRD